MKGLLAVLVLGLAVLTGCGGSASKSPANTSALAGNWQFTLQKTSAPRTITLLSGFLQQTNKTVSGSVQFTPPLMSPPPCGGAFSVSGTSDGQNVTLTVNEGGATVTLTGTVSGSAMGGSYNLVAVGCGKSETGTFTATVVKPIAGLLQGVLHSTKNQGFLRGGDFSMTGQILQGDNIGASSTTLTGIISSLNYPCFTDATISGTISGTAVQLDIIGTNGAVVGHVGTSATFPVVARVDGSGFSGFSGPTGGAGPYAVDNTPSCFVNNTGTVDSRDAGNVCVDVGSATNCKQPLAFSRSVLAFNPTFVGATSAPKTVTLTNQSSSDLLLSGPNVCLDPPCALGSTTEPVDQIQGILSPAPADFLVDASNCPQSPAVLAVGTSCSITVTFTPTASCPVFQTGSRAVSSPLTCPIGRVATMPVDDGSDDPDSPHAVLFSGSGLDAINSDRQEVDFGVVPNGTVSAPETITLTNLGSSTVTITDIYAGGLPTQGGVLPQECNGQSSLGCVEKCSNDPTVQGQSFNLPCSFVTASQVVASGAGATCQPPTALADTCRGQSIAAGGSCHVDVVFCPTATNFTPRLNLQIITDEPKILGLTVNRVVTQMDGQ